jgi:hypothetical protein
LRELSGSLSEAAASLDAVAVDRLQKQIDEEGKTFDDATDEQQREQKERIRQIQEQTQGRIDEEQRGFEQEMQERRTQAAQQVEEMRSNFALQEQRRAEDFALQMAREDERHQLELAREDQRFVEEQAQINAREVEALAAREKQFVEWYNAAAEEAGIHASNMLKIQQQGEQALEQEFLNFWNRTRVAQINQLMGQADFVQTAFSNVVNTANRLVSSIGSGISNAIGFLTGRAAGGSVSAMRPYVVGEQGPELFVPRTSGTIIPNGGTTVTIGDVSMSFPGVTNQSSAEMVQRVVYRELQNVFLPGNA